MSMESRNGYKLPVPTIDRSTAAMPGQHSRAKDKAQRLVSYHTKNQSKVLRTVTVQDMESGEVETYEISNESPLGIATLNKKVGEIVQVSAPCGIYKVEILKAK